MNKSRMHLKNCTLCRLSRTRSNVVPGKGPTTASVVFIGEAPGRDEDARGEPFVGRAGKVLDRAFADLGVSREDVFITNMVKCRPPDNRRPRRDEIDACAEHLGAELAAVRPKVVCLLGLTAARGLLRIDSDMSDIEASGHEIDLCGEQVTCVVGYHPAACLYRRANYAAFLKTVERSLKMAGEL